MLDACDRSFVIHVGARRPDYDVKKQTGPTDCRTGLNCEAGSSRRDAY